MDDALGFDDYQHQTAKFDTSPGTLWYYGLGLGEAGEAQGKIKKLYRDGSLSDESPLGEPTMDERQAIAQELGDVLWYIARAAAKIDFRLSDVAAMNLAKLESRALRGTIPGSGDDR